MTDVGFHDITVLCPEDKVAIGGGLEALNENESPNVALHGTHPAVVVNVPPFCAHAWEVEFTIEVTGPEVQAHVVCAASAGWFFTNAPLARAPRHMP